MQLPFSGDGSYTPMPPPTSSPPPSPTNPNASAGEQTNNALPEINDDVVKRKRGRPRKNAADGSMTPATAAAQSGDVSSPAPVSGKRPRGRPPGSTNKQQTVAASGLPGAGFVTHILDVKSGEDVMAKLLWFSQNSTRALCILSASGTISNVTLQQAATSGGTVTYEGRFEILSLSGSFIVPESDNQRSRLCGLSVALSGPDGRVLGGNVAGLLTAASPVQVVVGSFVPASGKQSKERGSSEAEAVTGPADPVSGSLSGSSGGVLGSPVGQSNNSNPQGMGNMFWG
ncbi:hypothetical protein QVD17_23809 [Tagetes erecta]|uniref:AT-hook motif nuclear-localized protein n=1 Tax=Tagetes erecta TaxID=13708 RepID=A0AAD8KEH5_TARER|nr:hypothetical protein QVD17_23809 [Tagetes erecta]